MLHKDHADMGINILILGRDVHHQPMLLNGRIEIANCYSTIITSYNMDKAICAKYVVAKQGHSVFYNDQSV